MNKRGTGSVLWPLVTGNNDDPTLTQGKVTSFFCNTVPDRCPTGPLAYYLPVFLLTIVATLTQPASGGAPIYWDMLPSALLESVDLINCWHGTPISTNYVKGANLPVVEFLSNGYMRPVRERPPYPGAAGVYPIEYTFALRPSVSGLGHLESETSQLALLYQTGQLKLNIADASAITSLSTGATLSEMSARCSAVLVPRNELVLGTPIESVLHEIVAGTNSSQIQIKGFGTDTAITGIEQKGGVVNLMELTSLNRQGGCFEVENITQYAFPWRGQDQIQHIIGFMSMNGISQLPNDRAQNFPTILAGGDNSMNQPPYTSWKSDQLVAGVPGAASNMDLHAALYWPMVMAGTDLALSDVQTADSDKSYFLQVFGGFTGETHMILGQYARRFNDAMRAAWVKKITGGNDPLAAYVLGADNVGKAQLGQRVPTGKHLLTNDNFTYLPWQLAAA
jgi:hypothetical protein